MYAMGDGQRQECLVIFSVYITEYNKKILPPPALLPFFIFKFLTALSWFLYDFVSHL